MSSRLRSFHDRREFLGTAALGLAGALSQGACRSRATAGQVVLRLSHSMAAGATALPVMAETFRWIVEQKTAGAIKVVFPSLTLALPRLFLGYAG